MSAEAEALLARIEVSIRLEDPASPGTYVPMAIVDGAGEQPFDSEVWKYIPVSGRGDHFAVNIHDTERGLSSLNLGAILYVDGERVHTIVMCPCCKARHGTLIPGKRTQNKLWKFRFSVTDFVQGGSMSQLQLLNSMEKSEFGGSTSGGAAELRSKLRNAGCIRVDIHSMHFSGRGQAGGGRSLIPPRGSSLPEGDATRKIKVSTTYDPSSISSGSLSDQASKWLLPSEGVTGLWTFDERLARHELRYRDINLLTKRGLMKKSGTSGGSGKSGKRKASDDPNKEGNMAPQQKKSKNNETEEEIIAWDGSKKVVTMVDLTEDVCDPEV